VGGGGIQPLIRTPHPRFDGAETVFYLQPPAAAPPERDATDTQMPEMENGSGPNVVGTATDYTESNLQVDGSTRTLATEDGGTTVVKELR
jgi:outer membrane scaffolding protein for murein synthesis (MipA/OmpV family)